LKNKFVYVCQQCGATAVKWIGKFPSCGAWNSYVEEVVPEKVKAAASSGAGIDAVALDSILPEVLERYETSDKELNRVLGGGIVPGSVVLIGGEPGIGKSTLMLQIALQNAQFKILYISGEESLNQIRLRANRLSMTSSNCYMLAETTLEQVLATARKMEPDIIIVDSIQTLSTLTLDATPGSVPQIRECTAELISFAKKSNTSIFLIGHITKDGYIAGPKLLEHMVDVVLYFEGDQHYNYRILRGMKNRFGSVAEIGIYEMGEKGLSPVANPSG
jgi:DNA repair protein RadA/Sms